MSLQKIVKKNINLRIIFDPLFLRILQNIKLLLTQETRTTRKNVIVSYFRKKEKKEKKHFFFSLEYFYFLLNATFATTRTSLQFRENLSMPKMPCHTTSITVFFFLSPLEVYLQTKNISTPSGDQQILLIRKI